MHEFPEYPVFVVEKDDPLSLSAFSSYAEAESDIEYFDVKNEEFRAWDAKGRSVRVWTAERSPGKAWLRVDLVGEESHCADLESAIGEYATLSGVDVPRKPQESYDDYYRRVEQYVEQRRWSNRNWWRKLLGLRNPQRVR